MKPVALDGWAAVHPVAWGAEGTMLARRTPLWIVLSVLVLGATGGAMWYAFKRPAGATGPAVALVTRRDLSTTVTATGTIGWPAAISWPAIIGAVIFAGIVGLVFGVQPTRKAADLHPVEALRG
jgi:ABC-type antimicrobial peptide transport system permease subunit